MSYAELHLDTKTVIARTSIAAWNALMRADPEFGRYALTDAGQSVFIAAFTVASGRKWCVGGKLHRVGGPALICANGTELWYERGERHRIGGPAAIYACGHESWYERNKLHRIGGPARTWPNGVVEYWEHGRILYMPRR